MREPVIRWYWFGLRLGCITFILLVLIVSLTTSPRERSEVLPPLIFVTVVITILAWFIRHFLNYLAGREICLWWGKP
jgi:hypothetical protein